mgnify:CR=1 FL=1
MPYKIERISSGKNKGKYRVVNTETGEVHAKATSESEAQRQVNLLRGVEHGWRPTGKKARS